MRMLGVAFVEGMVKIPLDVKVSALGCTFRTQIGGRDAEVRLPALPEVDAPMGELEQPAFEYVPLGVSLDPWIHESPAWGKWYLRTPDADGAAAISRVGLVVGVSDDSSMEERRAVATEVYEAIGDWCSLVLNWLEVAYGQRLRLLAVRPRRAGAVVSPWLWTQDGRERALLHNTAGMTCFGSRGESAIDGPAIQQVLTAAGTGRRPPLAWLLIRDALHQQWSGDPRRAVLDAGTAAELALAAILTARAIHVDGDRDTLGSLVKKAPAGCVWLPDDVDAALVKVRNNAAHRAVTATVKEASRALEISMDLVEVAHPRSGLLY
jgi:hypothetical protein